MNFQVIRQARKKAGITQQELAAALGVNRATISKYETGAIEITVSQLKAIAAFLGIDFQCLASDIGNEWFDEGFKFAAEGDDVIDMVAAEDRRKKGYTGSDIEVQLISAFSRLNSKGQQKAVESVEIIAGNPDYQKEKDHVDSD